MAKQRPYADLISHAREYDRLTPTKKGMERGFARNLMQLRDFEDDTAPPRTPKAHALKRALGRRTLPKLK